jgi:glycosyltransferase involved in cell wall biosynthesis
MDVLARLPGVHGLFVGDALFGEQDYVAQVRSQARALGIEGRVHFLGFRSDIPRLMRAVDVVLHTAEAPEPFGRVLVEAMLARRPVVAGRAGGAVEIVVEGETGLLVTPGDVEGYAAAVRALLADPERRADFGAAGAERAAREFSLDAMVRGVASEIEAATARRALRIASAMGRPSL